MSFPEQSLQTSSTFEFGQTARPLCALAEDSWSEHRRLLLPTWQSFYVFSAWAKANYSERSYALVLEVVQDVLLLLEEIAFICGVHLTQPHQGGSSAAAVDGSCTSSPLSYLAFSVSAEAQIVAVAAGAVSHAAYCKTVTLLHRKKALEEKQEASLVLLDGVLWLGLCHQVRILLLPRDLVDLQLTVCNFVLQPQGPGLNMPGLPHAKSFRHGLCSTAIHPELRHFELEGAEHQHILHELCRLMA
eukprot:s1276_g31.t1